MAMLRGSGKERKHMVLRSKAEIVDNPLKIHCVRCSVYNGDEIARIKAFDRWVCTAISVNDGRSRSVKRVHPGKRLGW